MLTTCISRDGVDVGYKGVATLNPRVVNSTKLPWWGFVPDPTRNEGEEKIVDPGDFLIVGLYQRNCSNLPFNLSDESNLPYRNAYDCCWPVREQKFVFLQSNPTGPSPTSGTVPTCAGVCSTLGNYIEYLG